MHEGVSDILVARARELDGVSRPITASFVIHVALIVTVALLPSAWWASAPTEKPMTITLGSGAIGPEPTGMTAMGGKKVEEVAPTPKRPEPIVPTTQKSTAMVEPLKTTPKPPAKPTAAPPAAQATPVAKPTTGAKVSDGNAVAATSASGLGAGLSSGGIGGVQSDADFCCKDYLSAMLAAVDTVWQPNQGGARGENAVEFTIEKSGAITNVKLARPSGNPLLDLASQRALAIARFPPIPDKYPGQRMIIVLTFPYNK